MGLIDIDIQTVSGKCVALSLTLQLSTAISGGVAWFCRGCPRSGDSWLQLAIDQFNLYNMQSTGYQYHETLQEVD